MSGNKKDEQLAGRKQLLTLNQTPIEIFERLLDDLKQLHYDAAQLHLKLSSTEEYYDSSGTKLGDRFLHTEMANLHREIIHLQDQDRANEEGKQSDVKLDIDVIMTGKPVSMRDKIDAAFEMLDELAKPTGMVEETALCQALVHNNGMMYEEAHHIVEILIKNGVIWSPKEHWVQRLNPKK